MSSLLTKAIDVARSAHAGQVDMQGRPYFEHLSRVANQLMFRSDRIVAYLHDITEDTKVTIKDLEIHGFDQDCLEAVSTLTKCETEEYPEYIERIGTSFNDLVVPVKLADIRDHLEGDWLYNNKKHMWTKYKLAEMYLCKGV